MLIVTVTKEDGTKIDEFKLGISVFCDVDLWCDGTLTELAGAYAAGRLTRALV